MTFILEIAFWIAFLIVAPPVAIVAFILRLWVRSATIDDEEERGGWGG